MLKDISFSNDKEREGALWCLRNGCDDDD